MDKRYPSTHESRPLNTNMRSKTDTAMLVSDFAQETLSDIRELGSAWLAVLRGNSLGSDLLSGLTVAAVALPLNIALAIACSLPPSTGFIAGLVGGAIAAIFGSSSLQVTGPSAVLSFFVFGVERKFGVIGVAASCLMIGVIQLLLGLFRSGKLSRMIPESILAGFTTGVGLKLLDNQIPDLLGFDNSVPDLMKMMHRPSWLHEVSWIAVFCGLFVASIVIATKSLKKFPSALVGITVVTAISHHLKWDIAKVGTVPQDLFRFSFPLVADSEWVDLFIQTIPLAILACIETLLSATAVDRMTQTKTLFNPNLELLGQGLANFASGVFGGMPVSGVIVRSSVNVQSGGKTRLASLFQTLFIFLAVIYLGQYLTHIPLAALAGLLCVLGARLIDINSLIQLCKTEKTGAMAFLVTMMGSVSHFLIEGLILGISIHLIHQFLTRNTQLQESEERKSNGIRAVLKAESTDVRRPTHFQPSPDSRNWLTQIRERSFVSRTSFVHNRASVIGRVVLGDNVHIAPESSVRADEGTPFYIGSNSNIQDGAVLHALKNKWISVGAERWAIFVGKNVSIAHQALVHGPSYIGDFTFIGFKAIVHDAVVGAHCYVGMNAIVVGVEIPDGKYVPHGAIIDTPEKVRTLTAVTDAHHHFNEDVVEVNRGLAEAYLQDFQATHLPKELGAELVTPAQPDFDQRERF